MTLYKWVIAWAFVMFAIANMFISLLNLNTYGVISWGIIGGWLLYCMKGEQDFDEEEDD